MVRSVLMSKQAKIPHSGRLDRLVGVVKAVTPIWLDLYRMIRLGRWETP